MSQDFHRNRRQTNPSPSTSKGAEKSSLVSSFSAMSVAPSSQQQPPQVQVRQGPQQQARRNVDDAQLKVTDHAKKPEVARDDAEKLLSGNEITAPGRRTKQMAVDALMDASSSYSDFRI